MLTLQGSFALHRQSLERCQADLVLRDVRRVEALEGLSALVVPGGESTTMENLAKRYGLFDEIRERGRAGLPIFGTCAGAILLGRGDERPERWEIVDVETDRNSYGTQVDSFSAELDLSPWDEPFHGVFIRAPRLRVRSEALASSDIEVLGTHDGDPVLVRAGKCLLATFHPELTDDPRVHEHFLGLAGIPVDRSSAEPSA